jgi:Transposase DNA-binding/Transposase Tn5 dimerisation domain
MQQITVKDFPHLDLGDVRRNERFVTIINNVTAQPGASIPRHSSSWYDAKATYEFFKNEQVSLDELNKAMQHYGASQVMEADAPSVLIIHDISNISYNELQAQGLGYLDNKEGRGILCYTSIAATPTGMPLSLMYQHSWIRRLEELGKADKRRQTVFEDKESYRWYEGMQQVNKLLDSSVHKLHIADREADIYELFFHAFEPATDLLIRARQNRSLEDDTHLLWDSIARQPLAATISLEVPDKTGKQKRSAPVEVRYHPVEVLRPASAKKDSYESVTLTAMEVKEISSSDDAPAEDLIHWKLLTTLSVNSLTEVLQCVKWYTFRWLIERFHYVLKSGTKIEELQLKSAQSLQKAIMVYSMAAFRVMQLVYAGRHYPLVSCAVVLTKAQWMTLYMLIHNTHQVPKEPPSLQQAVMWIGRLGGHLGRKGDGPPGLKTVWRGYQQLCAAASVYELILNGKI